MVRMRMTRSKTGSRRAHDRRRVHPVQATENGTAVMNHCVNPETGEYKGRVIPLRSVMRAQKRQARALAAAQEQDAEQKQTAVESTVSPDVTTFDSSTPDTPTAER